MLFFWCPFTMLYPNDATFLHVLTRSFCWDILCKGKNVLKLFYPSVVVTWKVPAAALPMNCTEIWQSPFCHERRPVVNFTFFHSMHRVYGYSMCVCVCPHSVFYHNYVKGRKKSAWLNSNWNCSDPMSVIKKLSTMFTQNKRKIYGYGLVVTQ